MPPDGLIVQGNVGIGLSNPTTAIDTNGIMTFRNAAGAAYRLFTNTNNILTVESNNTSGLNGNFQVNGNHIDGVVTYSSAFTLQNSVTSTNFWTIRGPVTSCNNRIDFIKSGTVRARIEEITRPSTIGSTSVLTCGAFFTTPDTSAANAADIVNTGRDPNIGDAVLPWYGMGQSNLIVNICGWLGINFRTGGNSISQMILSGNGNVGIGTTTPSTILDVNGNTTLRGSVTSSNIIVNPTTDGGISFRNNLNRRLISLWGGFGSDQNFYGFGIDSFVLQYNVQANASHVFYGSGTEVLRITNSNVGIRTATPSTALDVNGDSSSTTTFITVRSAANNQTVGLKLHENAGSGDVWGGALIYNGNIDRLQLGMYNNSTTFTPVINIDYTNRVGIGSINPSTTLDVSGTTKLGGATTVTTGGLTVSAGGATISAGGLTVSAGGATISAGGLTVTGNSTFNNNLAVTGFIEAGSAIVRAWDVGDLICTNNKNTGTQDANRYGIGQYSMGTMRLFMSGTYSLGSIRLSKCTDGSSGFTDYLTVDNSGNVGIGTIPLTTSDLLDVNGKARFRGATTITTGGLTVSAGGIDATGDIVSRFNSVNYVWNKYNDTLGYTIGINTDPGGCLIHAWNPLNTVTNAWIVLRGTMANTGQRLYSTDRFGVTGWSWGQDCANSDAFKIANSWDNLTSSTRLTILREGNVGIGTIPLTTSDLLDVNGKATIRNTLTVSAGGLTVSAGTVSFPSASISTAALSGTIGNATISDVNASKINAGTLDLARIPNLDSGRIPNLDASKITGGTLDLARIPNLDAGRIPNLDANKITGGTLDLARIPNLDANKIIGGTFHPDRIPNLDANKISGGTFHPDRIPNLDANKISGGTFHPDRIPNLDMSKITGNLGADRISGSIQDGQIAGISANKIAGTITENQLGSISASKIYGLSTGINGVISSIYRDGFLDQQAVSQNLSGDLFNVPANTFVNVSLDCLPAGSTGDFIMMRFYLGSGANVAKATFYRSYCTSVSFSFCSQFATTLYWYIDSRTNTGVKAQFRWIYYNFTYFN